MTREREGKLRWPRGLGAPAQRKPEPRLVIEPPSPPTIDNWRARHAALAPRTRDYTRSSMRVEPVTLGWGDTGSVGFDAADIKAMFSQPLSTCIDLSKWCVFLFFLFLFFVYSSILFVVVELMAFVCVQQRVQTVPRDASRVPSPTLPFDVAAHPAAKSAVGQRMLSRLATDAKHYAELSAKATETELVGASASAVRDPSQSAALLSRLEGLLQTLSKQREADLLRAGQLANVALALANRRAGIRVVAIAGESGAPAPPAKANRGKLLHSVARHAGGALSIWLELAIAWLLGEAGVAGELAVHDATLADVGNPGAARSEAWRAATSAFVAGKFWPAVCER